MCQRGPAHIRNNKISHLDMQDIHVLYFIFFVLNIKNKIQEFMHQFWAQQGHTILSYNKREIGKITKIYKTFLHISISVINPNFHPGLSFKSCMLGIFSFACCLLTFFKIHFFKKII